MDQLTAEEAPSGHLENPERKTEEPEGEDDLSIGSTGVEETRFPLENDGILCRDAENARTEDSSLRTDPVGECLQNICIPSTEVVDCQLPPMRDITTTIELQPKCEDVTIEEPEINQEFGRSGDDQGGPDREEMIAHAANSQQGSQVIPDEAGNLRVLVRKTKPLLGIAIEGGANTRHPLPRIININENGAAYDAGGLQVGQLILEVDGHKVEGMHHQEVARLIAESFAQRDKPHIEFLVVEAKKSNLEPKPTALIFLEA